MRIGTKSVLFGAHQFILHPTLLAIGWWQEYGFKAVTLTERVVDAFPTRDGEVVTVARVEARLLDPRLWLAFAVHDLGYLGKPNMDGPEGETHPELGARIMRRLFGDAWGDLCLLHSRYYAKQLGRPVSPLCHADKRVIILEPSWLYLPRVWATGELAEFMAVAKRRGETPVTATDPLTWTERDDFTSGSARRWHSAIKRYMRRWIAEHRGGKADIWTRNRHAGAA